LAVIIAELSVGGNASGVGGGAAAVISRESGFAAAFTALANAAIRAAAELPFVSIAAEILALAKRTANDLVLVWSFEALTFSTDAFSFSRTDNRVIVLPARCLVIF